MKAFTGGGWQDPESSGNVSEKELSEMSSAEFANFEQMLIDNIGDDDYMQVAALPGLPGEKLIHEHAYTATVVAGGTTGHNYPSGDACTNYLGLTIGPNTKKIILDQAKKAGVSVVESAIPGYLGIHCTSGHSKWGLRPGGRYTASVSICFFRKADGSVSTRIGASVWAGSSYQNFYGSTRIATKSDARVTIDKKLKHYYLAQQADRVGPLEAVFSIYTNKACTDLETSVRIKDIDGTSAHGETTLQPGKYWVKETRCPAGCAPINKPWPITVKAGDVKKLHSYIPDDKHGDYNMDDAGWVLNYPYTFNMELLSKVDTDTNGPLEGAIYKIQYSNYPGKKWQTKRTWYFRTDKKGQIKYRPEWLADKTNPKYKSDELFYKAIAKEPNMAVLPIGALRIQEVEAPEGYTIDKTVYNKKVLPLKDGDEISIKPEAYYNGNPDDHLILKNPKSGPEWKVQLFGKKINQGQQGLEGAEFGVFYDEKCNDPVEKEGYIYPDEDKLTYIIKSGPDGVTETLTVKDIPETQKEITLYVKELKAPDGYSVLQEVFPVKFTYQEYVDAKNAWVAAGKDPLQFVAAPPKQFGPQEGIVNKEGWKIRVQTKKIDDKGGPLAGAVFGFYWDEHCTDLINQATSGPDGMTEIVEIGVPMEKDTVTVYMKEISAPEGFVPDATVYSATFKKSDYDALKAKDPNTPGELKILGPKDGVVNKPGKVTPTPTPVVTPPAGGGGGAGVNILKTSTAEPDVMDLEFYTLEGAVFSVTGPDVDVTVTTDKNGKAGPVSLPDNHKKKWIPPVTSTRPDGTEEVIRPGKWEIIPVTTTYYVNEVKPPRGHKPYVGNPKPVTVTMPYDKDKSFTVTFEDEPIFTEMELEKIDSKGNKLKDVIFRAEYYDSKAPVDGAAVRTWYLQTDANGIIKLDQAHIATLGEYSGLSDKLYMHKGKAVLPIGGYLQLVEEDAPAEYKVDDMPLGAPTEENIIWKKKFIDDPEVCNIKIKKLKPDGYTPIAGVEFELTFLEEAIPSTNVLPSFQRLLKVGESIIFSTDSNGELSFEGLDQGKYRLTEVKTEPGNTLLTEPIDLIIELPLKMTQDEAAAHGNVDYNNAKEDVNYTGKWFFYDISYEVINSATLKLPMTGSDGIWKYGFFGVATFGTLATALIVLDTNRKKQKRKKRKKTTKKI